MKQERNAKCACGSGIKYKKCCLPTERENARLVKLEQQILRKQRAEKAQLRREQHLDALKANPDMINLHGMDPLIMSLAMAISSTRHK